MKRERSVKQRLIASVLVLIMCITSLLGTTFAWFTDTVTSAGNTIQAGSLKVDLSHKAENEWVSLKKNPEHPIFNYDKWEPGYTRVEQLKVDNLGSLSLQYRLSIEVAAGTAGKTPDGKTLADVIDVYLFKGESTAKSYADITKQNSGWVSAGTLSEVMANPTKFISGKILPTGKVSEDETVSVSVANEIYSIALHMQESAGNEYQNLSVGKVFVNLIATQWTGENDSFGNDYDDKAEFPEIDINDLSVAVEIEGGKVKADTTVSKDGVKVTIPAGVKVNTNENGTVNLVLSVDEKEKSDANVVLEEGEVLHPLDVHVEGVAEDNTVPMVITIEKAMPSGLNIGNYKLLHVEDGVTNAMTLTENPQNHNDFYYNPVTGDTTLAMATFSEVAVVADTENAWKGEFDYKWYDANATELVIANADQLAAFGAIVGGMAKDKDGNFLITYTDSDGDEHHNDTFSGTTVKLTSDINLGDKESKNNPDIIFYPIGYWNNEGTYERKPLEERTTAVESGFYTFEGTFDGNGHTIENFYQNTWEMKGDHNWYDPIKEQYYRDGMGLFGKVYGGTVKNLTVENFSSDGEIATTGVIAAYAEGATFENIAIFNCNPRVYNIGNGGIVGCVGWYAKEANLKTTFTNITVDNSNKISALWGSYDVACGGIVGQYYPTSGQSSAGTPKNGGIEFTNCHVSAIMDVYNDVCANYQYYAYRYTGMLIGSVRENVTIDGKSYPKMDGITASGCTVHFGDWNDYYYCELVANTTASYTHDHQMSRLEQVASVDVANKTVTDLDGNTTAIPTSGRVNYVVVKAKDANGMWIHGDGHDYAECYHFVDGAVWNHEDAGYHNGENGEKFVDENGDGEADLKEDKQLVYREFNNLVTGYGWGVTSRGFSNLNGVTNLDITQGDQEASAEKFEDAGYTPKDYRPGETITIGDLFKVKGNAVINGKSVYVSVSPITDGDKVSATFVLNTEDWTKSTITFAADSTGTAKVTITDYIFCTPTTIYLSEEEAVEKFTATSVYAQNAYTQITLGTLFGKKNGATIGNVTATVTDPNGNKTTVTGTSSDWASKTIDLVKEGTWTVSIVDDDKYCAATETTFTVNKVDKFTKKFDKNFLYRVGNQNTVDVGYIFGEIETAVKLSSVNVTITNVAGNARGTFDANTSDWTKGTIQFNGTGVVKVTISADGANPVEINLEVVDATNITSATAGTDKNFVLLRDVTYSDTYLYYKNSTLYGNGFTIDITGADHSDLKDSSDTSSNKSAYCNIWMVDSRFDNVKITGRVYPEVGMTADSDYGNAAIRTEGDCYITNSYISNCRVPLRVQGNTTLVDTVVDGGRYANIELRSGKLTLDGVTTINTVRPGSDGATEVIGFGIVIHSEAANASIAVIGDGLKQYNWVGENEHKTILSGDTYLSNAYKLIFNANNSDSIYFDYNDDRYVNTGILCLCADMTKDVVTGLDDRYYQKVSGYDAWVLTYDNSKHTNWFEESVNKENIDSVSAQYPVIPNYTGNDAQTVEFTKGETYYFETSVLNAEKFGQSLTISSVALNGTTYNYGDKIPMTEGGIYEIVYTVVDPYNYNADISSATTVNHTVSIVVTAVAKDAEILAPKFTFIDQNGNKYESTTVKVGDKTYVMPNVTAADPTTNSMSSINIGSASISGTTVYFPIATGYTVRSGSNFNRYYPLFNGINITDYTTVGDTTGTTYTTSGNYTSLVGSSGTKFIIPANGGQTSCGDYVKTDGQAGNAAGNSDSGWQGSGYNTSYGGTYLKSGNTNASSGADSNGYERIVWVEYCFNAGNGDVYYYRIGYHCNKESAQSCFTPDTLVTLADGTQKRVDELSFGDKILAWDFFTGAYVEREISLLVNHGEDLYRIANLEFSDGTILRIIGDHGVFDYDLNKFVYLTVDNMQEYIGHRFVQYAADGNYNVVTLTNAYATEEYTSAWSITSAGTSNAFASGMLTVAPPDDFYNWIEMSDKLTYDAEQFQRDVETYGLYTYDDFKDYVTYEQFVDWNGAYLKIAVEKGYFTFDYILELIELYKGWMP